MLVTPPPNANGNQNNSPDALRLTQPLPNNFSTQADPGEITNTQPHPHLLAEDTVLDAVKRIEISKSSGLPHYNNKILKSSLKVLIPQLTHIFNLSTKNSTFPASWKKALVIPIPKTGNLSSVSNFRPISLLPQPGKILEKLVHTWLVDYIESENLLSCHQYGFRRGRSTYDAIFQLTNHINLKMDQRAPSLVTFIDFRKAFDCVQHDILIRKLDDLDLEQGITNWLKDYLTDREQRVLANNHISASLRVKQGVPQGSIIGPLLYIIYANDLKK